LKEYQYELKLGKEKKEKKEKKILFDNEIHQIKSS
jgi:hypothetical protein